MRLASSSWLRPYNWQHIPLSGGALPLYESLKLSLRPVHVQPNRVHVPGRRLGALMAA